MQIKRSLNDSFYSSLSRTKYTLPVNLSSTTPSCMKYLLFKDEKMIPIKIIILAINIAVDVFIFITHWNYITINIPGQFFIGISIYIGRNLVSRTVSHSF